MNRGNVTTVINAKEKTIKYTYDAKELTALYETLLPLDQMEKGMVNSILPTEIDTDYKERMEKLVEFL